MAERYVDPFLERMAQQEAQARPVVTDKSKNSGSVGDFVDAFQEGMYQSAAGDVEAIGQVSDSDTFKSIGKALAKGANNQTDTMTDEAQQALSQHIFKDDPDSFTGVALDDGATNWRTWALQFGVLAGQVAGTVATGLGAGTVLKFGAKQVIKSVAKKAITKEAQQLVAKNAVKEAIRNGALEDVRGALVSAPTKEARNAVLNKATSRLGGIATTAVAGSMAAGMRAQQARDEYLGLDADTLNQNPEFQKAYWEIADNPENQGLDTATIHNSAKEMLAEKAATTAFFDKKALLSDFASGAYVPGAGGVIGRGAATTSKMGRFGLGLAQEGAPEAWQGGETQRAVNEAIKEWADESRDPMANVVRTRWEEGTLGGVFGGMAKVVEGQHVAPSKPIVTVEQPALTGNSLLDGALAQSAANEQGRYADLAREVEITQRPEGVMRPFDNPVSGDPNEPAFLRSTTFNPTGRDLSTAADIDINSPVQQALIRSQRADASAEAQLAQALAGGDQGRTLYESTLNDEGLVPESRRLPNNGVINLGGAPGDGINNAYAAPSLSRGMPESDIDTTLDVESTRDPRSPVAQAIASAGNEPDAVFNAIRENLKEVGKPKAATIPTGGARNAGVMKATNSPVTGDPEMPAYLRQANISESLRAAAQGDTTQTPGGNVKSPSEAGVLSPRNKVVAGNPEMPAYLRQANISESLRAAAQGDTTQTPGGNVKSPSEAGVLSPRNKVVTGNPDEPAYLRQLSTLRVTKRGKPFGSEKEAQLASRANETPVELPSGGFGVADKAELEQALNQWGTRPAANFEGGMPANQGVSFDAPEMRSSNVDVNEIASSPVVAQNQPDLNVNESSNSQATITNDGAKSKNIPDSILSAFPDMQVSNEGYLGLNPFTLSEREALKNAGLVQEVKSADGSSYLAVDPEKLWDLRKTRSEELNNTKTEISQEERNRAIENRASSYDRLANEQDELGDLGDKELAAKYRAKAEEVRQRKSTSQPIADQAAVTPSPDTVTPPVVATDSQPTPAPSTGTFTPRDGWETNLQAAREYANHLRKTGKISEQDALKAWNSTESLAKLIKQIEVVQTPVVGHGDDAITLDQLKQLRIDTINKINQQEAGNRAVDDRLLRKKDQLDKAITEAEGTTEKQAAPKEQFADNKLFTADRVAAARARMKSKMGNLNSGLDPEMLVDGMTIAGAYIESGVRNFASYAKAMTDDFGDGIKPFLLSFWEGARNYPGLDTKGMTSVEDSAKQVSEQPFHQKEEMASLTRQLSDLEADLQNNPVAPPTWLRSGAPVESMINYNGKHYEVTGHRWNDKGWFVLADVSGEAREIPYMEAKDDQGMPLYEEREFEAPEVVQRGKGTDSETKVSYSKQPLNAAERADTGANNSAETTTGRDRGRGESAASGVAGDKGMLTHSGITITVKPISQEMINDYNRSVHLAGKRDFNEELQSHAKNLIDFLSKPNKHLMDSDEQKAEAERQVQWYMDDEVKRVQQQLQAGINNPSWFVTGRSGRDMNKAKKKNDREMEMLDKHQRQREADKLHIVDRLTKLKPQEVKTNEAFSLVSRDIGRTISAISEYMRDGRAGLEKEARKWASPKAGKIISEAMLLDGERTTTLLKGMDEALQDVGGLVKVLGGRSASGKQVAELLGSNINADTVSFSKVQQNQAELSANGDVPAEIGYQSWDLVDENSDYYDGEDYALIEKIYVKPKYRRNGYARRLVREAVLEIQTEHPGLPIRLAAEPQNAVGMEKIYSDDLVRFYETEGFEVVDANGDMPFVVMEYQGSGNGKALLFSTIKPSAAELSGKGMTKPEAELATKEWLKQFKTDINVRVVKDQAEFKKALADLGQPDALQEGEVANAAYLPESNTILINAAAVQNPTRLRQILRHEVLAHYGLEKVAGKEAYQKVMDALRQGAETSPAIKAAFDKVAENYQDADVDEQMREVFAHYAENRPVDGGAVSRLWQRVVNLVKAALQKVGFIRQSEAETALDDVLNAIAENMRNGVTNVDPETTSKVQFSKQGKTADTSSYGKVSDALSLTGSRLINWVKEQRGWGLGTLTDLQIDQIYRDITGGAVNRYQKLRAKMEADRNDILLKAETEVDPLWDAMPTAEKAAMSNLMHDATMAKLHPDKSLEENSLYQEVKEKLARAKTEKTKAEYQAELDTIKDNHRNLSERYRLTSKQGKELYQTMRKVYDDQWSELRDAIEQRIKDVMGDGGKALAAQMRLKMEQALKHGPYFPLARFGDYIIRAKKGDQYFREHFEKRRDAEAALKQYRKEGFTANLSVKEQVAGDQANIHALGMDIMEALDKAQAEGTAPSELKDTVWQAMLEMLPDASFAKHAIHRKRTKGASRDGHRAYLNSVYHYAHHVSKIKYGHKMKAELDGMKEQVKAAERNEESSIKADDIEVAQQVLNEMNKRHELNMNPKGSALSGKLGNLGFMFYLGASPAAAVINLTQNFMVMLPQLAGKFGVMKASGFMLKAMGDYIKHGVFKSGTKEAWVSLTRAKSGITADEKAMLNALYHAGALDLTQAHSIAARADTDLQDAKHSAKWVRTGMQWAGSLFHNAEVLNREVAALTAYRLLKEKNPKINMDEAVDQVTEMVYDGHGNYAASNRPRFMRNDVAKVLTQFKIYSQMMTYTMISNAIKAAKGDKAALKTLGVMTGTTFMMAGMMGMPTPITLLLYGIAAAIDDDDDRSWEASFRLGLSEVLGPELGELVANGPLDQATNLNISGRVGMNNLWWRDPKEGTEGDDLTFHYVQQIAGPVLGIGVSAVRGLRSFADGDIQRGVEAVSPKVVKDLAKAYRQASEGEQTRNGDSVIDDVGAWNVAMQAMGFSSAQMAKVYSAREYIKGKEKIIEDRRSNLLADYFTAMREQDTDAMQDVMDNIREFNASHNKAEAITGKTLKQSIKSRERSGERTQAGTYLSSKREYLRSEGAFLKQE